MSKPSDQDLDAIIYRLSDAAQQMVKRAIGDRYMGLWVGNGQAVWELHQAELTECEPSDGGGSWGEIAPLNDTGIAVMARLAKLKAN